MFIIAEGDSEPAYSFVSCLARVHRLQTHLAYSDVIIEQREANMKEGVSNRPEIRCLLQSQSPTVCVPYNFI